MNATITQTRKALRRWLPKQVAFQARQVVHQARILRSNASRAFSAAAKEPAWLPIDELRRLHAQYPPGGGVGADPIAQLNAYYAPDVLRERGEERADEVLRVLGSRGGKVTRTLELGCADGMVSAALGRRGLHATGIDLRDAEFDPRAVEAGTDLRAMDACGLEFDDRTFDLVFSYDSMEHFPDPHAVMTEALRVTRPGGFIYLNFGPLYFSATGLHATTILGVPFCQHLFSEETLNAFCREEGLETINFEHCNGWKLSQYRALWAAQAHAVDTLFCFEKYDTAYLELIERYPSCFRAKTEDFDDLVVGYLEVLFRKRG